VFLVISHSQRTKFKKCRQEIKTKQSSNEEDYIYLKGKIGLSIVLIWTSLAFTPHKYGITSYKYSHADSAVEIYRPH
jgi:hypothetical protein